QANIIRRGLATARYHLRELAGQLYPRTSDAHAETGFKLGQLAAAREAAKEAAPTFVRLVLGDASPEQAILWQTTLTEKRLRATHAKAQQLSAELWQKAHAEMDIADRF